MLVVSNVFFYNFSIIMIYIRKDIKHPQNNDIILILLDVLRNNWNNDLMCDNLALKNLLWCDQLKRESDNSKIVYDNQCYKRFIIKTLLFLSDLLSLQRYDIAYRIVDILHVLPDVIISTPKKAKKDFWKNFIIPFEKENNIYFFKDMKKDFFS